MKARIPLAILLSLLGAAAVGACAAGRPPTQPPESHEAPPPREDPAAQLVRSLDALKQPSTRAVETTDEARSVIEAIGGSTQMQGDAGLTDH